MTLDGEAVAAGERLLATLDQRLPGRVAGLHLIGSAVLGDLQRRSDFDFAVITERPLTQPEVLAMRRLRFRGAIAGRRNVDLFFTTFDELARPAAEAPPGFAACGRRRAVSSGAKHPVAWAMLARHSVALRGPERRALEVCDDDQALRRWCRSSLDGYWRRWRAASASPAHWRSLWALTPHACVWGALSVARIHHTILTGEIISKSSAARAARGLWERRLASVALEALRLRRGDAGPGLFNSPWARRRALLEAIGRVVDAEATATEGADGAAAA